MFLNIAEIQVNTLKKLKLLTLINKNLQKLTGEFPKSAAGYIF